MLVDGVRTAVLRLDLRGCIGNGQMTQTSNTPASDTQTHRAPYSALVTLMGKNVNVFLRRPVTNDFASPRCGIRTGPANLRFGRMDTTWARFS